jgi:predicted DNA-binding transcriptional regulator AlpA
VALKDDGVIRRDGTLTRKQAVNFLGMNDTEFALRLVWDSEFPKAVQGGSFREADIVAWMNAQRADTRHPEDGACGLLLRGAPTERPRTLTAQKVAEKTVS